MKILKKILKWLGILVLILIIGAVGTVLVMGRAPAKRPDLVTALPAGVPAPPHGYPSEWSAFVMAYTTHDLIAYENGPMVAGVDMEEDIEYGKDGDTSLKLDLYTPSGNTETLPGVLLYFGGGWKQGDKDQLRVYAQHFAKNGYIVGAVKYRIREEGRWPISVQDANCAVRWMRANAKDINVDPDRIGVMGNSAGAYLALMAGYATGVEFFEGSSGWNDVSSAAQAVVDIYGPTDFTEEGRRDHPLITAYMNGTYEENPDNFAKASPLFYVDENTPPTCIIHGTVDMLVPIHQSDWLVEKLQEHNVPHYYSRIDGWPHAMDGAELVNQHTRALIVHFFDTHLKTAGEDAVDKPGEVQEELKEAA